MHRTLLSCFINFRGAFKVRLNCTAQFYITLFTSELHRTVCAVHLRYALIAPHSPELLLGKVTISIMRFCYSVQCGALRCNSVHLRHSLQKLLKITRNKFEWPLTPNNICFSNICFLWDFSHAKGQ